MTRTCEHCGTSFEGRVDARYCSPKCRKAASRSSVYAPEEEASITLDPIDEDGYDPAAELAAFQKVGLDQVSWITTGIPAFDALTQIPRGRITQIQGPYGVGKTTLCLNMLRGLRGKRVLYIDSESSLNPELLVRLKLKAVDVEVYNKSAFIEDIYDVILEAVKKPKYDLIILDSLAGCTFRVEAANEAADANIGQKAKIMNKLMRIIPSELRRTQTALVIINQERETIGGYVTVKYTPGGKGVLYGASLIVSLKSTKGMRFPKSGPPFQGQEVTAEILKSKVNEPWRKATFKLFYDQRGGEGGGAPAEGSEPAADEAAGDEVGAAKF